MANAVDNRARLCLVTPADYDPAAFVRSVADALAAGDVASLVITAPTSDPTALQKAAEAIVPVARARGVAVVIHNDTRIAARAKADGTHIDSGVADVQDAIAARRAGAIVGAGGVRSRDDAMELGEAEPDYLFFGRLDGDRTEEIHPPSLELAAWWASVAVIPAIVMGGTAIASVEEAATAGIEFVALRSAIWDDPRGPAKAVEDAVTRLASVAAETIA